MSETTTTTVIPQRNGVLWLILSFTIIGALIYVLLTWSDMHNAAQHINRTKGTAISTWSPIVWLILSIIPLINIYAYYRFWAANKEMAMAVGVDAIDPIMGFILGIIPVINLFAIFFMHRGTLNEIATKL
ncbi:MAG: hypothetical protein D6732_21830 [Methanobacteriota archaeon]|nr:MAG: hypothetical protein D6732_21830 [Euryarchaeota archaeon]